MIRSVFFTFNIRRFTNSYQCANRLQHKLNKTNEKQRNRDNCQTLFLGRIYIFLLFLQFFSGVFLYSIYSFNLQFLKSLWLPSVTSLIYLRPMAIDVRIKAKQKKNVFSFSQHRKKTQIYDLLILKFNPHLSTLSDQKKLNTNKQSLFYISKFLLCCLKIIFCLSSTSSQLIWFFGFKNAYKLVLMNFLLINHFQFDTFKIDE